MNKIFIMFLCVFLIHGCTSNTVLNKPAEIKLEPPAKVPTSREGMPTGYLSLEETPDGIKILSGPPVAGSAAQLADLVRSQDSLKLHGTDRWDVAMQDHDLSFPAALSTYDCALGTSVNEQDTPTLVKLLKLSVIDAGLSTLKPKRHFFVERPFVTNQAPSCAGDQAEGYKKSGAYPSGHTAAGWAWALILSEMVPERSEQILARGHAYSQSRVVCNLHWQSDVEAGRVIGSAAVEALNNDTEFTLDAMQAKKELLAQIESGATPARDCDAEANALAGS